MTPEPTIQTQAAVLDQKPVVKIKDPTKKAFLSFPIKEQILFAKRLSLLVKAGVPLLRSLNMIKTQTKSKSTAYILEYVAKDVEQGQNLSSSLAKFRRFVGPFVINLIQIGEFSGTLQENLHYLSEELKKKLALRRKVRSAMVYPAIIVIATIGISVLLTVFLLPKILPIFQSLDFELPWTTKLLVWTSKIMISYWYFILIGIILLTGGFLFGLRKYKFRYQFHRFLLNIPIFGRLFREFHLANFCRTLGLLLKTDVQIVKALRITAETTTNEVYKRHIEALAERITHGERMSLYLEKYPRYFPPVLTQMISVGESTGNLPGTFIFLAEMYENEVDDMTKNLSTIMEPVLMIFMGLIVGFIAISIITPIYAFTQNIHP